MISFETVADKFCVDLEWHIGGAYAIGNEIGERNVHEHLPGGVAGYWQGTLLPVADDAPWFLAEFPRVDMPTDSWVLMDLGDAGMATWTQVYLNGYFVGEQWSRKAALRFPVPSEWLDSRVNRLVIVCKGGYWAAVDDTGDTGDVCTGAFAAEQLLPRAELVVSPLKCVRGIVDVVEDGSGVTLKTTDDLSLRFSFPKSDILRFTLSEGDCTRETLADRYCLASSPLPAQPFFVREDGDILRVSTSQLCVLVDQRTALVTVLRADGSVVRDGICLLHGDGFCMAQAPLDPDEHIFGLGENSTNGMDKRGQIEPIWVTHDFRRGDKPIPFMLSTSGYGLYMHGSHRGEFDLGGRQAGTLRCWIDTDRIDLFLMGRRRFTEIISDYTFLTGRSPLPPRWAFGLWQSATVKLHQEALQDRVEMFGRKNLPVDVVAIDTNWSKAGYNSWEWDPERFPNPQGFLDFLAANGVQLSLWSGPFINPSASTYDEFLRRGLMVRSQDGGPGLTEWWMGFDTLLADFLNPETVQWWSAKTSELIKAGVRVIKIDGGDTNEARPDLVCHGGHSMSEVHNLYPVLFAKTVHEGIRGAAGDDRTLTWIRTGYVGIQRYPCCWGGDQWADFNGGRVLIKAGQQAGMAGISFWSHDLSGFAGKTTVDYHVRSYQWGLLSPLARAHGATATPWDLDDRAEAAISKYLKLRYRLLPSIYSYAWHSHRTGEPMMRAMVLDYQDDPCCYSADYQFKFGPDVLVAPIYCEPDDTAGGGAGNYMEGQAYTAILRQSAAEEQPPSDHWATREVYLPRGKWYDFWTDEVHDGGQAISCTVPLEDIPMFVRAGGILVYGPDVLRADTLPERMSVHIYAGGDGYLSLYEDDGHTYGYTRGEFSETPITLTDDAARLQLIIGPTSGRFEAQISGHALDIVVHGVHSYSSLDISAGTTAEAYLDKEHGQLILRNVHLDLSAELKVEIVR